MDGHAITLKKPPTIIIQCTTCGHTATTIHFTVETNLPERLFS